MIFDPEGKDDNLMLNAKTIYRYIHGGDAEVTLVAPQTNKAHTFAFCKPTNERDFPEDTIFVYVLHEGHKLYLGMLAGTEFRLTSKSRYGEDTESVKGARYIVKMSLRQDLVDKEKMHLYHSGRCSACGRPLRSKKALETGMGRKCLQRYNLSLDAVPWDGN